MTDLLIRGVPDEVLKGLDARAARASLSRNEYIRRRLVQDAETAAVAVTAADLRAVSDHFPDLDDHQVMAGAWD